MPVSRYPRRGHRLAPAALREVLQRPLPAEHVPGNGYADMLLCDLDETAWDRFGVDGCRHLAAEVMREVGRALRLPNSALDCRLPAIPKGLTLADLDLEPRTLNCLTAAGVYQRPQDLQQMSVQSLLGLRGFWVKSLLDLLTSLEHAIAHPEIRRSYRATKFLPAEVPRAVRRYPRQGERLAPQTMREVLLDPIPQDLVHGTPLQTKRLFELDETAWAHLTPGGIARVAELIVARAVAVVGNRAILQRQVPTPPRGLRLEDLRLENRTHNCLDRAGYGVNLQEMGKLTVAQLLSIKSFGARCLVDLLSALETRAAQEGRHEEHLIAETKLLESIPQAAAIQFTDPRLGGLLRCMDTESNTIGEMVRRIRGCSVSPVDSRRLCEQLAELRAKILDACDMPLGQELVQIFASGGSARDQQIVAEYHGWTAEGPQTLERLGRKHGLSRERVRQICIQASRRNSDGVVFAPALQRALAMLTRRLPMALGELQAEFDASGICGCRLTVEAVQQAARLLYGRPPFSITQVGRGRLVVLADQVDTPRTITEAALRIVNNYGAGRIAEVTAAIDRSTRQRVDRALICETLQARRDFCWLDDVQDWFRLDTLPQYGLPRMIEKVLSVAQRIDVGELHTALGRRRRRGREVPPRRVLLEFCRRMQGVRVEGNTILSSIQLDWRTVLSGVERSMVEVLQQHGGVMERNDFEQACAAAGLNRFSFATMLASSLLIQQHERRVYGLVGQRVDRRTIRALGSLKSKAAPGRVLRRYGQTADGKPYVLYRLSKATVSCGVVTIPAALKQTIHGSFTVEDDDCRKLGKMTCQRGCGWGLGPPLRRCGSQPGDHVLLVFDIARQEVRLCVGDETLGENLPD